MFTIRNLVAAAFLCCIFLQNTSVGNSMHCRPSRLKGIILGAMPHVKDLQNRYELERHNPKCRYMLRMKDLPGCNLTGMERLPLTLYRLSLVVKVLENMVQDALVKENLETFATLETELSKCEIAKTQQGDICQRRLMKNTEKVSSECLRSDVLFNLIWTLSEDVGLVLPGEHQRGVQKGSPPVISNAQSSKKRKGKKKGKKNKAKSAKPAA